MICALPVFGSVKATSIMLSMETRTSRDLK